MLCYPCAKFKMSFSDYKMPSFGIPKIKSLFSRKSTNVQRPDIPTSAEAIKNLGEKAEGILEEQKKKVEELAIEKKNAAAAMLEQQKEKIGDLLWQSKSEAENLSTEAKQAVDGFENEIAKETERVAEETLQQVSSTVDEKLKESEEFIDEKREEAVKSMSSASESVLNPSAVLGKAKGFLN